MKKMIKALIIFSCISPLLLGCQTNKDNKSSIDSVEPTSSSEEKEYNINAISPMKNEVVSLASEEITEMVNNYTFSISASYVSDEDHYASRPIELSWDTKEDALYYLVELATNSVLNQATTYVTNIKSIELDDLKPGYVYYWRVNAYYSEKLIKSQVFSFETMAISKSYYMESVKNFRDMGGYKTIDNKRVKSGMIFRGANADGVNEQDKDFMLHTLNIKSELDLRNKNEGRRGTNVLGAANYYVADDNGGFYYDNYPNGVSQKTGQEVLAREIRLFANRDNYPIYYHCAIGRDRTGSLAMVLYNLLGVSKKDIGIDYEISMFAVASTRDIHDDLVEQLVSQVYLIYNYIYGGYTGNNMQEKTEAFLLEIGITQLEIDNIKDIMLEDF